MWTDLGGKSSKLKPNSVVAQPNVLFIRLVLTIEINSNLGANCLCFYSQCLMIAEQLNYCKRYRHNALSTLKMAALFEKIHECWLNVHTTNAII